MEWLRLFFECIPILLLLAIALVVNNLPCCFECWDSHLGVLLCLFLNYILTSSYSSFRQQVTLRVREKELFNCRMNTMSV